MGRLWETGDQDHHCYLLSRTLVPIPVGDGRHAQVVMIIDVKDELEDHQLEAPFMAKPHHDWPGSGMHVHLSLLDNSGQNLFAGDPISPLFRHALGGMPETMADFMAVWAQSANAYRRYVPKSYV